jgi:hypothetical protein
MAKPEDSVKQHSGNPELRVAMMKERRLLIAASGVLIAHLAFGITVENSAETLGLKFTMADPSKLWWLVWIVWGWSMFRYIIYFHDFDRADLHADLWTFRFRAHEWFVRTRLRYRTGTEGIQNRAPRWGGVKVFTVNLGMVPERRPGGAWLYPNADITLHLRQDGGTDILNFHEAQTIPAGWLRATGAWAWLRVLLLSRHGTEYFAPFAMGAAPLVIQLYPLAIHLYRTW